MVNNLVRVGKPGARLPSSRQALKITWLLRRGAQAVAPARDRDSD